MRQINPFVKCVAILISAVLLAFSFSIVGNLAVVLYCFILMMISRVNLKRFVMILIPVCIVALSIFTAMYLNGAANGTTEVVNSHDFYSMSLVGASFTGALAVSFRILAFAFMGMLFTLTTDTNSFLYSLMQQGRLKPKFAYGIMAAFNLIPVIIREISTVKLAYKVRGYKVHPLSMKPVFTALVNTLHWAEDLAMAMESKGFDENANRTMYIQLKIKPLDILFALVLIAIAAMGVIGL